MFLEAKLIKKKKKIILSKETEIRLEKKKKNI